MIPAPPVNPYAALMQPLVIVADHAEGKSVIADAGTIIKLLNQKTLYRDRISPITQRSDEILVQYGKMDKPTLGWLTNKVPSNAMKAVKGPTFLVTTQSESDLSSWDAMRLKIARARKGNPAMWCAPWMVLNGKKYPRELREVTKLFGGTTVKNEGHEARCQRLFSLILHTEIDMSSAKAKSIAKSKGKKKGKKSAPKVEVKKTKKTKKSKSAKPEKKSKKEKKTKTGKSDFSARSRDFDSHVVKRLIQENPRRAGSNKAKVWDKLKKGMTVEQFASKGGSRAVIARYIENGWVKLLKPAGAE